MKHSRLVFILGLIVAAAVARILPHPWNFTPVGAIALFAGAHLRSRRLAYAVPLAAMLVSDLVIGLHPLMPVVYACFALTVGIGRLLRGRRTPLPVAGATLASSVLFFVVTNFGVWALGGWYPLNLPGLIACYVAGIPYFRNTLLSDALYTAVLFGGLALAERAFPSLREVSARNA